MKRLVQATICICSIAILFANINILEKDTNDISLNSLISIATANAEDNDGTMYEDKFDLTIGTGGINLGVCCDPDDTDGCWDIWRKC